MTLKREQRLHALISEAIDRSDEDRHAFLRQECADDPDLRAEVLRALGDDTLNLETFLETPPGGARRVEGDAGLPSLVPETDEWRPDDGSKTRIGPYTLMGVLGEGGMGRVFLAVQEHPVRRQVALKVIRSSLRNSQTKARFLAERQALARLSHPSIGPVLDAGATEDGFPYLVTEVLENAAPITVYCDRHRLTIEDRLALMAATCRGVEHAHRRQVLHRDLKPSNIQVIEVDGKPVPKIIDFGIAKALDQPLTEATLATGFAILGTPAYMAPEALNGSGDVDTRGDVYALGVVLYELLTGSHPFQPEAAIVPTIVRRILEDDADRPSARVHSLEPSTRCDIATRRTIPDRDLPRKLRGDLDWIVLEALAKDRDRRYGSAAELAADIERYLRHEPVAAGAPTVPYIITQFLRRHRLGAAAGILVTLALLLGIAGTTFGMRRAHHEAREARRALAETQITTDFLTNLFEQADPWRSTDDPPTVRQILDRGAGEIATAFPDQPLARAGIMSTIGRLYHEMGSLEAATSLRERALALREAEHPPAHPEIAASLHDLAQSRNGIGDAEGAEALLQRAVAIRREALPGGHPDTGSSLLALGLVASSRAHLKEAETILEEALAILDHAHAGDHPDVADALLALGENHLKQSDLAPAEDLLERGQAMLERLHGADHPRVVDGIRSLAELASESGRYVEAAAYHRRALAILERVLGTDHPKLVRTLSNLGNVRARLDDQEGAERLLRRALSILESTVGPDHINVAGVLNNLAGLAMQQGQHAETIPSYERALAIAEAAVGTEHPAVAAMCFNLGLAHHKLDQTTEAEPFILRALAIRETVYGSEHPEVAAALRLLAQLRGQQSQFDDAEALHRRALAMSERVSGPNHPDVAEALNQLAPLLLEDQRVAEAQQLALRGLTIRQQTYGDDHTKVATSWITLARVARADGRDDDAESAYQRAIAINEKTDDPALCQQLAELGDLYRSQGRPDQATTLYRRAITYNETHGPRNDELLLRIEASLASIERGS